MSATIFRYLVHADDKQKKCMGVTIVREVQELWLGRLKRNPKVKLLTIGSIRWPIPENPPIHAKILQKSLTQAEL